MTLLFFLIQYKKEKGKMPFFLYIKKKKKRRKKYVYLLYQLFMTLQIQLTVTNLIQELPIFHQ